MTQLLRICHLYPDLLNLYGDRGNVLCLQQRLLWRGIGSEVVPVGRGEVLKASEFDLFFIGGGQDFEQTILMEDLKQQKAAELKAAAEDGKAFLCICGGYQLMGEYYKTATGDELEYLGICGLHTEAAQDGNRLIGDLVYELSGATPGAEQEAAVQVVGFENHGGRTYLHEGVKPLGKVVAGFGNNGKDGTEGVHDRNIFGTYAHGPVAPKNPALADAVLLAALQRKYGCATLPPLPDEVELRAHATATRKALGPKSKDLWM